jgi:hypothetical protein
MPILAEILNILTRAKPNIGVNCAKNRDIGLDPWYMEILTYIK